MFTESRAVAITLYVPAPKVCETLAPLAPALPSPKFQLTFTVDHWSNVDTENRIALPAWPFGADIELMRGPTLSSPADATLVGVLKFFGAVPKNAMPLPSASSAVSGKSE